MAYSSAVGARRLRVRSLELFGRADPRPRSCRPRGRDRKLPAALADLRRRWFVSGERRRRYTHPPGERAGAHKVAAFVCPCQASDRGKSTLFELCRASRLTCARNVPEPTRESREDASRAVAEPQILGTSQRSAALFHRQGTRNLMCDNVGPYLSEIRNEPTPPRGLARVTPPG
jgi:hypothetical protein